LMLDFKNTRIRIGNSAQDQTFFLSPWHSTVHGRAGNKGRTSSDPDKVSWICKFLGLSGSVLISTDPDPSPETGIIQIKNKTI
jgi:hypothetical protein